MPYFRYDQNNSGGCWDEEQGYSVFIEAPSEEEADRRAETIGIYFDGVEKGMDCSCCGDRWYVPHKVKDLKEEVKHKLEMAKRWKLQIGWLPLSSDTLLKVSDVKTTNFS